MTKEIILYNMRDDVKKQDYVKRCEDYKGPLLIGLPKSRRFTLLKMMGGVYANGQKGNPPSPAKSPFNYVGILDTTSLKEWGKSGKTEAFKEFLSQWLSKRVAQFNIRIFVVVWNIGVLPSKDFNN